MDRFILEADSLSLGELLSLYGAGPPESLRTLKFFNQFSENTFNEYFILTGFLLIYFPYYKVGKGFYEGL